MCAVATTRVSLIQRVRDPNDAESWREFESLYKPLLLQYLARRGLRGQDALDLVQDVFVRLVRAMPEFELDHGRGRMNPHPNVVTAMHASEHEGRLYLVMQFVPGLDTEKHVEQHGPLAPDRACDFLRQAAAALAYVHEHGLVHRDVTPRNLLIAPDGV